LSFKSGPKFPSSIGERSWEAQIELFQSLFADYSKLGLTEPTDRSVAIESLAVAMAEAVEIEVYYGIFRGRFFHRGLSLNRSLLWQPAENAPLTQIAYPAGKEPPSWSWMAYHGPIQYLQIEFGYVEWDGSVRLVKVKTSDAATSPENDDYVLEARVRRLRDCKTKGVIVDGENNEVGHRDLNFETQLELRCAIMGRETIGPNDERWKYYVLFVTECTTRPECGKFKRVGMGSIQQRFILFDDQDDTAQIL
jgi:hypothetical protein